MGFFSVQRVFINSRCPQANTLACFTALSSPRQIQDMSRDDVRKNKDDFKKRAEEVRSQGGKFVGLAMKLIKEVSSIHSILGIIVSLDNMDRDYHRTTPLNIKNSKLFQHKWQLGYL